MKKPKLVKHLNLVFRVIDYAIPEFENISPIFLSTIIIFFIAGLILGIGIIVIREFLKDAVHSIEEIENKNIPILGIIPTFDQSGDLKRRLFCLKIKNHHYLKPSDL